MADSRLSRINEYIQRLERRISALERINQSKTLQFGNVTLDGTNGRILTSDGTNNRVLLDGTGVIKVSESGVDVLTATNSQLTFLSTFRQLRESNIHTSGGNTFTNVAPYVSIADFLRKIDFSDWEDMEWYFEASFKAGTGTAYVRLYNQTDGAAVSGSVLTTTSTSYTQVRSSAITKPSGTKTFVVQYGHDPSGGGGDFINLTIATHIFRRPA